MADDYSQSPIRNGAIGRELSGTSKALYNSISAKPDIRKSIATLDSHIKRPGTIVKESNF